MNRVVVTGLGTINPLGSKVDSSWNALINSKSGIKNITDWFALMPDVIDFDLNDDSAISSFEYYIFLKAVRARFQWKSGWIADADEDKSGFVSPQEWAKQVAKARVNGDWVKVFDANRDGKMSVEEEVLATRYITQVREYYTDVVDATATSWSKTIDIDEIETKYDADGSWSIDNEELAKYLNDNIKSLMFHYDWNGDGEISGIENDTLNEVIRGTFNGINEYLADLKAQFYSNIL